MSNLEVPQPPLKAATLPAAAKSPSVLTKISPLSPSSPLRMDYLTSEQWEKKFKYLDDNVGVYGCMKTAAAMAPSVPYNTLRSRYLQRKSSPTRFGPRPVLDIKLERLLVDYIKRQNASGFSAPKVSIVAMARKIATDIYGPGAANCVGGKKWYKAFLMRNRDIKEMNSSLMEEERSHAVSREGVWRYMSLAEIGLTGVLPKNSYFTDEMYIEFHSKHGWTVS
jgi:hypothetical protein